MITSYTVTKRNEDLRVLYISPNIFRKMKLMRMNWAGHVTRMGYGRDTIILYILRKNDIFFL